MHLGIKRQPASGTVPLQTAVLCVECESLSHSRGDECAVCGSHSIFRIAPVLGGSILGQKARVSEEDRSVVTFNLEITISLKQVKARDVNATLQRIASLISPKFEIPNLEQANASLHVDVVPVTHGGSAFQEVA